jgi:sporulation protein YlmC with PRC-barrel domain
VTTAPPVSLSELRGQPVCDGRGKQLGTVDEVLFHPQQMRAVGVSVRPMPGAFSLIQAALRKGGARRKYASLNLQCMRNPPQGDPENWDRCVVFRGMPLVTAAGVHVGRVHDATLDTANGALLTVDVTSGAATDVTLGKRTLPASDLLRFRQAPADSAEPHLLVVADGAGAAPHEGGLAATAGIVAGITGARTRGMWKAFKKGYAEGLSNEDEGQE